MYIFAFVRIEEDLKLDYSDVLFRPKEVLFKAVKTLILKEPIDLNIQIMSGQVFQ